MNITQLEGKHVKICPRSIKAIDETGKTCGVVTGVMRFKDAPLREQSEHFNAVRSSGLWGCRIGVMDNVIISGRKLYYLNDVRPLENFVLFSAHLTGVERDRYKERLALAEHAAQYMTVINVYCK